MKIGDWVWLDFGVAPGPLDWIGFVLGGIGIVVALFQLFKSKGALNSAQDALESTRNTLIKNQLLAVLPAFQEISRQLDKAVTADSRQAADEALDRFCNYAHQAATLLKATSNEYAGLASDILQSADEGSKARAGLYEDPLATTYEIVGAAATAVRNLAPRVNGASVSVQNDPGRNT